MTGTWEENTTAGRCAAGRGEALLVQEQATSCSSCGTDFQSVLRKRDGLEIRPTIKTSFAPALGAVSFHGNSGSDRETGRGDRDRTAHGLLWQPRPVLRRPPP